MRVEVPIIHTPVWRKELDTHTNPIVLMAVKLGHAGELVGIKSDNHESYPIVKITGSPRVQRMLSAIAATPEMRALSVVYTPSLQRTPDFSNCYWEDGETHWGEETQAQLKALFHTNNAAYYGEIGQFMNGDGSVTLRIAKQDMLAKAAEEREKAKAALTLENGEKLDALLLEHVEFIIWTIVHREREKYIQAEKNPRLFKKLYPVGQGNFASYL